MCVTPRQYAWQDSLNCLHWELASTESAEVSEISHLRLAILLMLFSWILCIFHHGHLPLARHHSFQIVMELIGFPTRAVQRTATVSVRAATARAKRHHQHQRATGFVDLACRVWSLQLPMLTDRKHVWPRYSAAPAVKRRRRRPRPQTAVANLARWELTARLKCSATTAQTASRTLCAGTHHMR